MFLDAAYSQLFHTILLVPTRWIASRLPGSVVPPLSDEKKLLQQEEQCNDTSIAWPSHDAIAKLPQDWVVDDEDDKDNDVIQQEVADTNSSSKSHISNKKRKRSTRRKHNQHQSSKNDTFDDTQQPATKDHKVQHDTDNTSIVQSQPYYLNHVRGSTRIRQASVRISAAIGTLCATYILCSSSTSSSLVTLDDIGLRIPSTKSVIFDLCCGFAIGSFIVIFIFLLELRMGWIKIIGWNENVVPEEVFAFNITWDVLFHIGVSFNEEVMLRGWMFMLGCRGLLIVALDWFDDRSNAATFAVVMSTILQSTLFASMHYSSPGSTRQSLLNLFFGGVAASLNVLVAGGTVWLGIGW